MQSSKYLSMMMMMMMMINYIKLSDSKLMQGRKTDSRAIYSVLLTGHAIAQAVWHWLLITEPLDQPQETSCKFMMDDMAPEQVCLQVYLAFLC
jgi:hypothetical protein